MSNEQRNFNVSLTVSRKGQPTRNITEIVSATCKVDAAKIAESRNKSRGAVVAAVMVAEVK